VTSLFGQDMHYEELGWELQSAAASLLVSRLSLDNRLRINNVWV